MPIYCASVSRGRRRPDQLGVRAARDAGHGRDGRGAHGDHADYLVTLDFHGFKLIVNKLHGVYMNVDHRYLNTVGGPSGYAKIDLQPGYQKLDGQQALDFVRFRHTDSDLYRLARQQLFVTALRDRIACGSDLRHVLKIVGALKGNLEIAQGGGGAVPADIALSYLQFAHSLSSGHFFRDKIENVQGYGSERRGGPRRQSRSTQPCDRFSNPDVAAPTKANDAALGIKHKAPKPQLKPSEITTLVLNGTLQPGLAANTSYNLLQLGYRTLALGNRQAPNAPNQSYALTQIYYAPAQPKSRLAASELQEGLQRRGGQSVAAGDRAVRVERRRPQTVVVIGANFDGHLHPTIVPPA